MGFSESDAEVGAAWAADQARGLFEAAMSRIGELERQVKLIMETGIASIKNDQNEVKQLRKEVQYLRDKVQVLELSVCDIEEAIDERFDEEEDEEDYADDDGYDWPPDRF